MIRYNSRSAGGGASLYPKSNKAFARAFKVEDWRGLGILTPALGNNIIKGT